MEEKKEQQIVFNEIITGISNLVLGPGVLLSRDEHFLCTQRSWRFLSVVRHLLFIEFGSRRFNMILIVVIQCTFNLKLFFKYCLNLAKC